MFKCESEIKCAQQWISVNDLDAVSVVQVCKILNKSLRGERGSGWVSQRRMYER